MWKKWLRILVESCVYMDPYGFAFHAAAKRAASDRASSEQDEADERQILRLIERLEPRREAQA